MAGHHRRKTPQRTWHEFPQLPPRPNPDTGEPLPPHAPGYSGPDHPGNNPRLAGPMFGPPEPPPGMGPCLAWHRDDITGNIRRYIVALAILALGSSVLSLLRGDTFGDALTYWPVWIVIVVFAYLMSDPLTFKTMSAGADWLQWGTRKRWYHRTPRAGHVKFYDLVSITASGSGITIYLRLEDTEGNVLYRMPHALQQNRHIWDLLYNGILHSVANGAEIDNLAIKALRLDETQALQLRQQISTTDD
ncbi:hypothetical protein [Amycolatopsis aidingensis]|uniref:hypothetical protein n=1 Tax=Amycolatopsis aidingensis TaxID=2842453 RepID=UPI001C0DAAB7|nr:hypothetical protein [Amycolatopsis aidingensis]